MEPWAYFLTVDCYGVRLHGDSRGSVDRDHNTPGGRFVPESSRRRWIERTIMTESRAVLFRADRGVVLEEIQRTCEYREWELHAAHV